MEKAKKGKKMEKAKKGKKMEKAKKGKKMEKAKKAEKNRKRENTNLSSEDNEVNKIDTKIKDKKVKNSNEKKKKKKDLAFNKRIRVDDLSRLDNEDDEHSEQEHVLKKGIHFKKTKQVVGAKNGKKGESKEVDKKMNKKWMKKWTEKKKQKTNTNEIKQWGGEVDEEEDEDEDEDDDEEEWPTDDYTSGHMERGPHSYLSSEFIPMNGEKKKKKKKLKKKVLDEEKYLDDIENEEDEKKKKKKNFSKNFINFLKNYNNNEQEGREELTKGVKRIGIKNVVSPPLHSEEVEYEDDHYEDDMDTYKYFSQKDDVYKIDKPDEHVDISDFIYSGEKFPGIQISEDIKLLKRGNDEKGTRNHISILEEEKMNSHLSYIKNVELLNKMNKSFFVIQNSQRVHFGYGVKKRHGAGEMSKASEFINKGILRRYFRRGAEVGEVEDVEDVEDVAYVAEEVEGRGEGCLERKGDVEITAHEFEKEMENNLRKSKMLIVSDDVLKTEKEKKMEELKKISQLKALLLKEHKKNKYKKRIKSKSYRRHLRMKEKKQEEKILEKIYSEHPYLARNIENYEKEYAKKRNLINNVKKRKAVRMLNRYKNEELKKQMLRSFQADKEEKNMLKRIIEKVVVQNVEDVDHSGSDDSISLDNDSAPNDDRGDMKSRSEVGETYDESSHKKRKVRKELQKRNLLRFSFVKNAEERKRDEEIYQERKKLLSKIEQKADENDGDSVVCSSTDGITDDAEKYHDLEVRSELHRSSKKEVSRARAQLAKDTDLENALRKGGILGEVALSDVDPSETNPLEKNRSDVDPSETNPLEKNRSDVDPSETNPLEKNRSDVDPQETNPLEKNKLDVDPLEVNPLEVDPASGKGRKCQVKNIFDIDAIDDEAVLQNCGEKLTVYNFENNIYEDYINVNLNGVNVHKEDEELYELSDSEKVELEKLNVREWCNYETLLEMEKNKIIKEKEIIEKKKKIPIHSINLLNKKDKKFNKYYIDKVPYPYEKSQYEKSLNINLNKEVNDLSVYSKLITPQISNRIGNIISPLVKNPFEIANIFTLKRGKNRAKL
ncbi:hypothetical protein, conserved [Plasmodium gonderi]|uniref:U3 small nucleolar RNA-associated protein 14 n=1 Tax=Plasmodium gonderi TaxID=77519 RepID=A0A1Y1JEY2_PLAGO|nr:hypothetical protein, conserved [Plasmodium gonderi]GAW79003.1 hypothetical protein, conserved [Plasmodium gonderi]